MRSLNHAKRLKSMGLEPRQHSGYPKEFWLNVRKKGDCLTVLQGRVPDDELTEGLINVEVGDLEAAEHLAYLDRDAINAYDQAYERNLTWPASRSAISMTA